MPTEPVVVDKLTKDVILSWSAGEMLSKMKNPETRAEIERVFNSPEVEEPIQPDPAVEEQRIAEAKAAEEAENARIAAEAETQRLAEEAKTPVIKKLIVEYQATDPVSGVKIGRPTHLETTYIEGDKDSLIAAYQEMSEKQRIAHVNATQALENIKKQKVTFKEEPKPQVGLTEEEILKIASELDDDPEKGKKKADAVRKLSNADAAEQREREAIAAREAADAERASLIFMRNHMNDFYPCQANSEILQRYFIDNNLAWTTDNLEIAFAAIESQLAPVPSRPAAPQAVPVAAVPAQPVAPEELPTVPSVATAPVAAPVPAPSANPATVRRVPNGGIQPGTMTGRPPAAAAAPRYTKRDILKMPRDEYKQKIKSPEFRALVEAIFANKASA